MREIQTQAEQFPQRHDDIKIMRNTGLYGEDEDHPVDFIGRPSPKGDGYDVLREIPRLKE